jgi:hypothetical protein
LQRAVMNALAFFHIGPLQPLEVTHTIVSLIR